MEELPEIICALSHKCNCFLKHDGASSYAAKQDVFAAAQVSWPGRGVPRVLARLHLACLAPAPRPGRADGMGWDGTAWHGVATSPPRAALLPGHRAVGRGLGQPSVRRAPSLPSCARQLALWEEQPQEPEAPSWRGQLRLTFLVCLWSLTPELQFSWMSPPV